MSICNRLGLHSHNYVALSTNLDLHSFAKGNPPLIAQASMEDGCVIKNEDGDDKKSISFFIPLFALSLSLLFISTTNI